MVPFSPLFQPVQQQLSKKEIEDLLRKGAYGAIMDEEDEGAKFCEEDIDQILQRRTKTITIESEGRGSTFAKVRTSPPPPRPFRLILLPPSPSVRSFLYAVCTLMLQEAGRGYEAHKEPTNLITAA